MLIMGSGFACMGTGSRRLELWVKRAKMRTRSWMKIRDSW